MINFSPFSKEMDGGYLYNQVSCLILGLEINLVQFSIYIMSLCRTCEHD